MSTLEKPGIAWADQQPVRQPVRRCGFRELRPPRGGLRSRRRSPTWRARSRAVPSRSRSRRVAFRRPSAPGERAGVPPPRRSRSTPTTSGWRGQARRHRLGRLARRRAATGGLGLRGLAARVFGPRESRRQRRLPARVGTLSVRVSSFTTVMSRTVPSAWRTAWTRSTTWRIWARSPSTFVPEAWFSMIRPDSLSSSSRAGPRAARRHRRRSGSPGFRLSLSWALG